MVIEEAKRLNSVQEYYFSRKLQEIAKMRSEGKQVINLGIGSPDLKPSQATIDRLVESANNDKNHGYQSYRSIPELRQAIAFWYERMYGVSLNPDNEILPLIGSKEGIMHISMSFLNPGDEVLVPNPGYPTYSSVSQLVGAKIRHYSLKEENGWLVDPLELEKLGLEKVKILWLNYPNMPTGTQANWEMFQKLITLAKEYKFLIVNDNPYSMVLNDSPMSIMGCPGAKDVVLEMNSMSKSHNMAGWRLGWVSGAADYIGTILKFKSNMDSGMFLPVQHAAIEALNNSLDWHTRQNEVYRERRKYVWQILDMLGCHYDKDQVGMFKWAKVNDSIADVEAFVHDILQQTHVFITPGFIFGSNGSRYIRISLCADVSVYQEAISRLKRWLKHAGCGINTELEV